MSEQNYLRWLVSETPTTWWHDSGIPDELRRALAHGATGVTTNPVLAYKALSARPVSPPNAAAPETRAESFTRAIVQPAAEMFLPTHARTRGKLGYVCAQVNPALAGDRQPMLEMAKRFHAWAPNIAVKLPVTAAGLDVLEDCVAQGITITATVSFTLPQALAIAERHRRGIARARQAGKTPGRCFAVIMIGRLDDYLKEVAHDRGAELTEADLRQAGLAVTKRAYSLYLEHNYDAVLVVAALRGTYHMVELAGAKLIVSIHPKYQALLLEPGVPRDPQRIAAPVDGAIIARLRALPEFVRAYEPDGMTPNDFVTFGATQRTLSQFLYMGWSQMEAFQT